MIEIAAMAPQRGIKTEPDHTWPHVLLVIDQFDRFLGGGERILLRIAQLLPEYRFRASILTFSLHPDTPALKYPPCPIYLLPLNRIFSLRGISSSLALSRFLTSENVQIVQTFFGSSDLWGGLVAKTMSSSKLVWFLRDLGFQRTRKQRIAYRLMSGFPDAVFAVSEEVRNRSIKVDRISPARIQTIYNGLSPADWSGSARPLRCASNFHITTVGNIRRVKGHDLFIEAAAEIRKYFPSASFSVVGDVVEPDFMTELQCLSVSKGLQNHLRFLSGETNIPEHLAQSDIFVLASRSEGFSNAIIEAMTCSLPVVATEVGGNSEAVKHGSTGLLVPPEDVHALAEAILGIMSDPPQALAMGNAGRNIAIKEFTTVNMMQKITRAYSLLLEPS